LKTASQRQKKLVGNKVDLAEGEQTTELEGKKVLTPQLSIGAIIGIVIGSIVAVGLIGLVILLLKPKPTNPEDYQTM